MKNSLPVNGDVLRWARESQGLSIRDVAEKLSRTEEQIKAWEDNNDDASPPYGTLEKLAYELYKRPLALFFFPEPPEEEPMDKSFRTLPEYELRRIPPKIRYFLRKAKLLQMNLAELFDGRSPSSKPIVRDLKIDLHESLDVPALAARARDYLGISVDAQQNWQDDDKALKSWRSILENHGVFTFKDSFSERNKGESPYSGFCLYSEEFPIIYLNNNMPKTRQIFTLFHELAHLLREVGGIDKRGGDHYIDNLSGDDRITEILCNKFSAEFLIPSTEIDGRLKKISLPPDEETLSFFAGEYHVSREVILRRMLDLHLVAQSFYEEKVAQWKEEHARLREAQREAQKAEEAPSGHYHNTQFAYLSRGYLERVFEQLYRNKISQDQVVDYLGVDRPAKITTVEALEKLLLSQTS